MYHVPFVELLAKFCYLSNILKMIFLTGMIFFTVFFEMSDQCCKIKVHVYIFFESIVGKRLNLSI